MWWIAQAGGIGAMVCLFCMYQQPTRKRLLLLKMGADICWVVHYLCLGAVGGAIPNFVGVFRETVFMHRGKRRWADWKGWPFVFVAVNLALGLVAAKQWIQLLPVVASASVTLLLWNNNPRLTKVGSAPVSAAFLVYDIVVRSQLGVINESLSLLSILLFLIKKERRPMSNTIFSPNAPTSRTPFTYERQVIADTVGVIPAKDTANGAAFAEEITKKFIADFEKKDTDRMVHVSTFLYHNGNIYMTYYANTQAAEEDPNSQTARLAFCPVDQVDKMTVLDIQSVGDTCYGLPVVMVYDTILMQKDETTLFILWTANIGGTYYRLYRSFDTVTGTLGEVGVNRFKVGDITNDFSQSGIIEALAENGIGYKTMYSDIGIMQKLSTRVENGETYYYTGTYSGDFNAIIKSRDFITWEYVSQPSFLNESKWENAVYVIEDRCYYFVRQNDPSVYGFLTVYHIDEDRWETPLLVEDCQSRGDFILYQDRLFLFHAPTDREHIGILEIDTENIANCRVVLQAKMDTSCFYPFVQYGEDGELKMSYTIDRKHIRLAGFTLSQYID